jgi:NADPH:quinone reductase-like Zn-dependent oxidoreductase
VANRAIGLNFIDTYFRSGLYQPPALPSGLGTEGAGVVEAVGSEVEGFAVGDRIAQLLIQSVEKAVFTSVEKLPDSERGETGFGSSGRA